MNRSALATFIGVYLDEDLFESYADEFDALAAFRREQPRHAASLDFEVHQLLASDLSDADFAAMLRELGLRIDLGESTYREWLARIAEHVRTATT